MVISIEVKQEQFYHFLFLSLCIFLYVKIKVVNKIFEYTDFLKCTVFRTSMRVFKSHSVQICYNSSLSFMKEIHC